MKLSWFPLWWKKWHGEHFNALRNLPTNTNSAKAAALEATRHRDEDFLNTLSRIRDYLALRKPDPRVTGEIASWVDMLIKEMTDE